MKLCFLDMDGTIARVSSPWQYVYERAGLWDSEGVPILERYLTGEIDYFRFCEEDMDVWIRNGLTPGDVRGFLDEIEPFPEAEPLLAFLRETPDITTIVLSAGFDYLCRRILRLLGVDETPTGYEAVSKLLPAAGRKKEPGWIGIIANGFSGVSCDGEIFDLRIEISEGRHPAFGKQAWVTRAAEACGLEVGDIFSAGDGVSDEEMFRVSGCSKRIRRPSDLLEFLDILKEAVRR